MRSTNAAPAFFLAEKLSSMSCVKRVTWSAAHAICQKPVLWQQCVGDCFDTNVDESLEDFKGDTQQRYRTIALWVPNGFFGLGIATTSALLQIFGILSWRMQELRKSQNQDLRADPARSINSRKMETNPGDFPGFRCLRAAANSSDLKGLEIL